MNTYEFQMICLFSIIDSFAQEDSNYKSGKNQEKFGDFILKYQKSWSFLEKIDPVTLFYDAKNELKKKDYLNCLMDGIYRDVNDVFEKQIDNSIIADLRSNKVKDEQINRYIKHHKFSNLLYQIRNKISHELSDNSHSFLSDSPWHTVPYYTEVSNFRTNNHYLSLIIPISFMRDLVNECCGNYLNDCLTKKIMPFGNDTDARKSKLCWYDNNYKS